MILNHDHEIIKWLKELQHLEEDECAKYSSTIILNSPKQGCEAKFYYHISKLELINASISSLLGIDLLRKPKVK
jgi:hypothetical protein